MTGAHIFCIGFLKIPIYLSYKPEGASLSAGDFPKGKSQGYLALASTA